MEMEVAAAMVPPAVGSPAVAANGTPAVGSPARAEARAVGAAAAAAIVGADRVTAGAAKALPAKVTGTVWVLAKATMKARAPAAAANGKGLKEAAEAAVESRQWSSGG